MYTVHVDCKKNKCSMSPTGVVRHGRGLHHGPLLAAHPLLLPDGGQAGGGLLETPGPSPLLGGRVHHGGAATWGVKNRFSLT